VDSHDDELYSHFKSVVGAVLLIFHPLSINTLSDLLRDCGTPPEISTSLRTLHSLLLVPDSTENPVRIFHKSFPDFLTDPKRCTNLQFFIDLLVHHKEILLSCLNVMGNRLKRNICNLDDHVVLSEVKDLSTQRATYIGDALEYMCCFWANHLAKIPGSDHDVEEVHTAIDKFSKTGFLFWIEILILTGKLDIGVYALNDVEQWYILVSDMWSFHQNLYLCLFRQELPASGQVMASTSSWKILMQSPTLLPQCTILLVHLSLPHLGSMNIILQGSRWW